MGFPYSNSLRDDYRAVQVKNSSRTAGALRTAARCVLWSAGQRYRDGDANTVCFFFERDGGYAIADEVQLPDVQRHWRLLLCVLGVPWSVLLRLARHGVESTSVLLPQAVGLCASKQLQMPVQQRIVVDEHEQ